ncbi:MAG: hypothetical protein WBN18_09315 [Flavobacteriaceae bacterium]
MRSVLAFLFLLQVAGSCIPLRTAPEIADYRVTRGKKFNRKLPQREMYIFKDTKEADAFYNYVDVKYDLNHQNVYEDVPFMLEGTQFFFSFYEVEITDKSLNLFPAMFDLFVGGALGWEEPILSDDWEVVNRKGNWFVAIEVYNDFEKDCLSSTSLSRPLVLNYLTSLKDDYISHKNFLESQDEN